MRTALGVALLALVACKSDQRIAVGTPPVGIGEPPPPDNPVQVDRILQVSEPSVDVLFVVDNSCSMVEEQELLATNFPHFLDHFLTSGLVYHIAVVSTDMEDPFHSGKLQAADGVRYIQPATAQPEGIFAQMVQLGTEGWGLERGRDALFTALDLRVDSPTNQGFYRHQAALHVIFVSDEDDDSVLISRPEFDAWIDALKPSPDQVTLHAIVAPNLEGPCAIAYQIGHDYLHYAQRTGGLQHSICATNWAPMLDALGLQASGLRREYFLTRLPVEDSLRVEVSPPAVEGGPVPVVAFDTCLAGTEAEDPDCEVVYIRSRNSVAFLDFVPEPLSEVHITYHVREDYSAELGN